MIKKLKRIVVGIDIFSKSNIALERALMIAKNNNSELYIVHIVETPWLSLPSYFGGEEIMIDTQILKKKITKKLKDFNKNNDIPCTIFVKEGSVVDTLLHEANLLKADILVIGANTKKQKKVLGTSAEKIIHQSKLPVLVVKNNVKKTYQNIVAPTDFQSQSIQGIKFAQNIFPKAEICAVHSIEMIYYMYDMHISVGYDLPQYNELSKENAEASMKKLIKDLSLHKGKNLDSDFESKKALLNYIKNASYDLTVVGSRSIEGFASLLLGSVSSTILRKVKTDVLVYVA
ncbi:MAG: hypothetical protein COA92_06085 [Sulfurovum sp.]|nr:MAG: hypothetical protein COA92_06085 [Sulfurovum sp.]